MAANQLRITCTTKSSHRSPTGYIHGHLLDVGVGSEAGWTHRYTVAQVRAMLAQGWVFYTVSPSTKRTALVEAYTCCGIQTLRTLRDAVADNNLDNLPTCQNAAR
jgi:hypothetical protein